MYFIITALAAIVTTVFCYNMQDKHRLSILCFIYWGATLMWLVDHVLAFFIEGGELFEMTLDAALLGCLVVLSGFFVWGIILFLKNIKRSHLKTE
ncbi:hypothetical protein [Anaerotignum sp. MB30-C6]|uniref:hypothetical protein n=1 Tax=Anaerotignum sp. MB30-C6 TaxID=3070814 RepID=UPI0027DAE064|nr:hypothetical protein [Anaerotignum sp. MB30-C6]WMI79983.1 hypothetical protein RBQ60_09000 [Anaerotignum sp. MB30-C6]